MPSSKFWRDRQGEFERYAMEYSDLIANWDALGGLWWLQYGHNTEGILHVPQQCKDVFKAVARNVISGFPDVRTLVTARPGPRVGGEAESWFLWLDTRWWAPGAKVAGERLAARRPRSDRSRVSRVSKDDSGRAKTQCLRSGPECPDLSRPKNKRGGKSETGRGGQN
jgi:hypothetical protein